EVTPEPGLLVHHGVGRIVLRRRRGGDLVRIGHDAPFPLDPAPPSYGGCRSGATVAASLNRRPDQAFIRSSPMADADRLTLSLSTGGDVVIKLRPDLAPGHVQRITDLANSGFYDGVVFHRVIPGFMAQG